MKVIAVSGYFDPLHIGHIELIKRAKSLSSVNKALNSKTIIKTIFIPKKILNIVAK